MEQSQVSGAESERSAGRIQLAGQLGIAAYIASIGAALATSRVAGFPWEVFLVVLYATSAGLWLGVARQPLSGPGFERHRGWLAQAALGALVAAGLNVLLLATMVATGFVTLSGIRSVPNALTGGLLLSPLVALGTTALPEEALFRGFFQRTLASWLGPSVGVAISALLFALAHVPQRTANTGPTTAGFLTIQLLALLAFGLLMSWTVVRTGALWLAIGWHFGGNYVGVVTDQFVLQTQVRGPAWLLGQPPSSGGDGVLGLAFVAAQAIVIVVLLSLPGGRRSGARS